MNNELYALGFDRFQRFCLTGELLADIAQGESLSILEMGAFDNAFAPFVSTHRHQCWPDEIRPGKTLPFADGGMDITLALDVLEHVVPEEREFFIGELARVAGRAAIIGFPVSASAAAEEFVLKITGSAWLAQHRELGLPDKAEVENIFEKLGLRYACYPNGSLPSWTAMMLLMHGTGGSLRESISSFFNRHYYCIENREPAYRYIYVLERT